MNQTERNIGQVENHDTGKDESDPRQELGAAALPETCSVTWLVSRDRENSCCKRLEEWKMRPSEMLEEAL